MAVKEVKLVSKESGENKSRVGGGGALPAHVYIYTLSHSRTYAHTLRNPLRLLKPPQGALFICFLFPCYIVSATTVAVAAAAGGAGSAGSVT